MRIKHTIFFISIYYVLSSSTSTGGPPTNKPPTPNSPPESPDSRPEEPDSTTESVTISSLKLPGGLSYPDIEKKCGADTSNPIECVALFSPLTDGVKTDPIVALKAGLNAVTSLSKQALEKADMLKKDPKTSINTGSCLGVCIENYHSVPKNTESALTAIEKRDMDSLKTYLSADVTSINTCIDVHDKNKSPLKEVDSTMLSLVRANLEIGTNMIKF